MSAKSILSTALMVGSFALFAIPGVGTALGLGAQLALGMTAAQVVGIGLALTSSLLLGPSTPKVPASLANGGKDRLYANLDTTAPRKIVFGDTAGATDIRYQSFTGSNQEYYEDIIACASHTCNSIYEIWSDNEKAWTSAGGVLGRYVGYLTVDVRNPGTSANGIAIDSTWTTSCTLTGCAYVHLKYKLTGPDNSTPSPFQGGVSQRVTIRTRGALVYDPRLDSTVTGGSGSHRPGDQTTWAWNSSGSRNPALQLLFYLLGWKINSKVAVGMGLPPARIDLASFITAANICDEPVALAAGGTEPRYRSDGVISESDDRKSVIDALCAAMNAQLRDDGGKVSIQVLFDDLSTVAVTFDEGDIIGDEEWNKTPPLTDFFNIYRGKFTDASDNALYQPSDYPEVSIASPDGIDRINSFDQPLVQSVTQAQRLAKLRLMRNQYQGRYSATYKAKAWGAAIGKIVTQTHSGLSWTAKTFRVAEQKIGATGQVPMTLVEESTAIYAWSTSDEGSAAIAAGTPVVADPAHNPLVALSGGDLSELIKLSEPINPDASTPIITASDTQIFIKNHQRRYSDKTVSVNGNYSGAILDESGQPILDEGGNAILDETGSATTLSGLTAGTNYFVGYNDQSRTGGAVTYVASTSIYDVTNSGAGGANPYMHFLGQITTAGTGSGTTTSGGIAAPVGYSSGQALP